VRAHPSSRPASGRCKCGRLSGPANRAGGGQSARLPCGRRDLDVLQGGQQAEPDLHMRLMPSLMSVRAARTRPHLGEAMTVSSITARPTVDSYLSTRDFEYGVHDEVRSAVQQLRCEIATRIRRRQ
jgi:hypothetical protein